MNFHQEILLLLVLIKIYKKIKKLIIIIIIIIIIKVFLVIMMIVLVINHSKIINPLVDSKVIKILIKIIISNNDTP
jgi:hypothetical protein